MSRPNLADWQYLGVDKITRRLEWNSGRKARKGHICEDSLAYASYSSKDMSKQLSRKDRIHLDSYKRTLDKPTASLSAAI